MQTSGYIEIDGERIKLLIRKRNDNSESIKIRITGRNIYHMSNHEDFLKYRPDLIKRLKNGEVVIV
jgi:hypothetical protein